MPRRSECVEIGVYKGDFSARILEVVRPEVLHLVDPWRHVTAETYKDAWYGGKADGQEAMDAIHRGVLERFRDEIGRGQVVVHRADSLEAAGRFPEDALDWVYVDGDHLYGPVKADLSAWCPKLRPGGFLTGDDYKEGGWWQGGVKKAVDEFLIRPDIEPVAIDDTQYILRRLPNRPK